MFDFQELYGPLKTKYQSAPSFCVDIDDTLAATNLHWAQYHINNFGNPENLTPEDVVNKYRYVSSNPYWQTEESNSWILSQLSSNEAQKNITTIENARESLELLNLIYPNILYLTTRPEDSLEGTINWLNNNRFPKGDVVCEPKQKDISKGLEWKAKVLSYLSPEIQFVIDDNEELGLQLKEENYDGNLFLFSHDESEKEIIIPCKTWNQTVFEIFSRYSPETTYLSTAYDIAAKRFLETRISEDGISGIGHRLIEQPSMFSMVSENLKGKELLDIGCGPGIHAKKYLERGANVYGIDISSEMIKLAKIYAQGGSFSLADAKEINYDSNKFDIITSSLLLDHISDLGGLAKEVRRLLNSSGEFIFSIPHPITGIIAETENGMLVVNGDYYERKMNTFTVAGQNNILLGYKRTLTDYFTPFLETGFRLSDFRENKPIVVENLNKLSQIPSLCTFKWAKN